MRTAQCPTRGDGAAPPHLWMGPPGVHAAAQAAAQTTAAAQCRCSRDGGTGDGRDSRGDATATAAGTTATVAAAAAAHASPLVVGSCGGGGAECGEVERKEFGRDAPAVATARDQNTPGIKGAARVCSQPVRWHAALTDGYPLPCGCIEGLDQRAATHAAAATTSIVSHHASVRRHACSRMAPDEHQKGLRARAAAAARADEHSGPCAALMPPCVASHGRAATRQALLTAQPHASAAPSDAAISASLAESAVAGQRRQRVVSSRADVITHERTGQPFARGALIHCQHCRQAIGEVAATLLRMGATLSRWLCTGDCLQARQVACGVLSVLQLEQRAAHLALRRGTRQHRGQTPRQ